MTIMMIIMIMIIAGPGGNRSAQTGWLSVLPGGRAPLGDYDNSNYNNNNNYNDNNTHNDNSDNIDNDNSIV